ncbi:MAG: MerR family transcriptional regulator [Xanthobacteraceae bacterium]
MNKAPDAFRTISEVAAELDLPQHVLRFWESRFPQIKPLKRGGGRRYYRPDDVELLRGIRHLLYGQGYTIRGVQRILREQGPRFVQTVWQEGAPQPERRAEAGADEREYEEADVADAAIALPAESTEGEDGGEFAGGDGLETPQRREPPLTADVQDANAVGDGAAAAHAGADAGERPEPQPAQPQVREISSADRERLQAALEALEACKNLLDTALTEAEQNP